MASFLQACSKKVTGEFPDHPSIGKQLILYWRYSTSAKDIRDFETRLRDGLTLAVSTRIDKVQIHVIKAVDFRFANVCSTSRQRRD
jgi:hypothetical protein